MSQFLFVGAVVAIGATLLLDATLGQWPALAGAVVASVLAVAASATEPPDNSRRPW